MTSVDFRKRFYKEFQDFLNSDLGKAFQVTILYEREKSHLIPTGNLEYNLTEISSAQYHREKGWDACFYLIRECATPVIPPSPPAEINYGIPEKKGKK